MFPLVQMHLLVLLVFVLFAAPSGGGWSDWNAWASCSVTCGGGSQTRNRTCTNPPPRSHLINCLGSRLPQSRLCNTNHCPVHGGWSDWKEWSHCTKAIGGIQIRTRECVNPKPRYGGKPCSGNRIVVRGCGNTSSCHEAFPVRFRTKESPSLGTMEIFRNKTWEKLCTAIWNDAEENLTCRAMGYFNNGPDENSTGQEGRNGSNTTVNRICKSFTNDCVNNSKDDLQKCKVPVRLNGAKIEYGGRVEVFYRGKWGKICRKEWGLDDVKVVCNQLGFRGALAEFVASEVKEENIPYLMSGVSCSGHESDLASCKRTDGDYDCPDDKGAQALCEPKNRKVLEKKTFVSDIGSSETFKCSLKNDTSMTKWYIEGAGASLSGGRIKKSGGTLTIKNVQLSDGGTYECRGLKYTRFYTIYVNAIFKDTPIRQTLTSGTSAIVKCSAVGTPIPQFDEWKKDGNKTLEKGRFTRMSNGNLRVYPVRPEDQGKYTCAMKQNKGDRRVTTKFRIIHVSVVVPPKIQLSGPKLTVREGDNVSLTCIINEGSPTPKIKWTKDETSKDETKNVLHLIEVTAEDEGRYTCKAENEGGSSNDSTFVTVDVPPKVNPQMMNQSVPLSSAFALKCIVGGKPTPKVNWTKNGRHLANNSTTLRISHVTFDDAGQYECSVENRAGKIRTSFWMDVTVSPQVYVSPTNQTVPEGKAANISCKVTSGVPKPSLSWNFQGRRLPEEVLKREIENGSVLQMQNTTKGMEGTYKCVAKNKANEKIATSTLHVLEKPTAEVSPKFFPPFLVGDDLTLTCKVSGEKVEVKWKKDGSPVTSRARISQNGDKSTLVIKNVETVDSGDYSCEAHNEAGFMSSAVEIKVRVVRFVDDQKVKWYHIVAPTAAVIFLILGGWYICKRRMLAMAIARARSVHQEEQAFELEELNHEVDEWEITRDRITLDRSIGFGAFGEVWKATLRQPNEWPREKTVAAKCFTPTAGEEGRKALMREIELGKLLEEVPQPNIVKFIGCVTTQIHPIMIMEYMAYGDLLGYLRKSRGIHDQYHHGEGEAFQLQPYDLVLFAKQIATGMVYLESRGIIHRNLAARNVLLDSNFVCKVTDLGLAYQNFKYGHGQVKKGCIPVKWTAPEILYGNLAALSAKSDVWSYGIVLYEIFTLGGIPYPEWSEGRTIAEIQNGYHMPKPEHLDDHLYHIMEACWQHNPDFRPPFEVIRQKLIKYVERKMYEGLLSDYDSAKYSKVEDKGAEDTGTVGGAEEQAAGPSNVKLIPPPRRKFFSVQN